MLEDLEYYLVGGAVRDALLGLPEKDRDYVVVGATPAEMIARGFRQVGRDFPVFIHPATGEEYALARTERKAGRGHRGFTVYADPDVTLEQDLARRDLTINAIARAPGGDLVDPFDGRGDLERRLLRHVSAAFTEDPLRVLRVARFMARFAGRGFTVAAQTLELMAGIAAGGELETLSAERVWSELEAALLEPAPDVFVTTLRDCGALARLLPEVERLFGVPQTARYHPEIDTGVHLLMVLREAVRLSDRVEVRFAALLHDLGKADTPAAELPAHHGHETRGVPRVEAVCERLRVPNACRRLALAVCRHHLSMHRLESLRPATVLALLGSLDAMRRPEQVTWFALACEADARGRGGRDESFDYPSRRLLEHYRAALAGIDYGVLRDVDRARVSERAEAIRLAAVKDARRSWRESSAP